MLAASIAHFLPHLAKEKALCWWSARAMQYATGLARTPNAVKLPRSCAHLRGECEMRLLVGFLLLLALAAYIQSERYGCSLRSMAMVDWLECVSR